MESNTLGNTTSNSGIAGGSDGMVHKATAGAHAAVNTLAGAADEAARKAKPAIEQVAAMAHQVVDKAAGAATPTADWLAAQGESLNATQKKLVAGTCNYVSANPFKALGIALAAGFLISRITR
jgi:ElaB/YqjD/DUF883 family membrane-anchored ribosome-binding protein